MASEENGGGGPGEIASQAPAMPERETTGEVSIVPGQESGDVAGLTAAQERAIGALLAGESAARAAAVAGVTRMTVYRWRQGNPIFLAALNAHRRQQRDTFRARLAAMDDKALEVVSKLLDKGNLGAAKLVISSLESQRIGPGTADGVVRHRQRARIEAVLPLGKLPQVNQLHKYVKDFMEEYTKNPEPKELS